MHCRPCYERLTVSPFCTLHTAAHMQEPAPAHALAIPGASCNVIPQQADIQAQMGGPLLRAWQMDPFNKGTFYYQTGFDTMACTLALSSAVGAPWVTKPGPGSPLGMPIPLLEGVALTNHITSTECGNRCAFTSKALMSTALVRGRLSTTHCV
jgi:hypothetical protein